MVLQHGGKPPSAVHGSPRTEKKTKKKLTPHNHPHTRNQIDNLGFDAQIGALAEAAVDTSG